MSLLDSLFLDPHPFNVWIAKRADGLKGSGTASDPYDGGTATRFDALLNSIPANTHIHLGPGEFETNGYADGESTGWQPKAGMKIEGSGVGITTLKLVGTAQNKCYFAIGHALSTGSPAVPNLLDFFEVSDLTIDCNLAGPAILILNRSAAVSSSTSRSTLRNPSGSSLSARCGRSATQPRSSK